MNSPAFILVISLAVLWCSAWTGARLQEKYRKLEPDEREDFGLILGATLTLLGLIIGFSFSMAISRYDQRKQYEEEEANAIGTEYVRAELLPGDAPARIRKLLRDYLDERIRWFETRDDEPLRRIETQTTQLQGELWSVTATPALKQPTSVAALAVSGMNDVLNSQGYTQAAWWNRIPGEAWVLMAAIAICSNLMLGYGVHRSRTKAIMFLVLPLSLSISFCLIADIDSPRTGLIRVHPQNLMSLRGSLRP